MSNDNVLLVSSVHLDESLTCTHALNSARWYTACLSWRDRNQSNYHLHF